MKSGKGWELGGVHGPSRSSLRTPSPTALAGRGTPLSNFAQFGRVAISRNGMFPMIETIISMFTGVVLSRRRHDAVDLAAARAAEPSPPRGQRLVSSSPAISWVDAPETHTRCAIS